MNTAQKWIVLIELRGTIPLQLEVAGVNSWHSPTGAASEAARLLNRLTPEDMSRLVAVTIRPIDRSSDRA